MKIALVESDPQLREIYAEALEADGRNFKVFESLAEFLEFSFYESKSHTGRRPFDVLFTDVLFGGIPKINLIDGIIIDTDIKKIVLITGFSHNDICKLPPFLVPAGIGKIEVLQKPFKLKTLTDKIKEIEKSLNEKGEL